MKWIDNISERAWERFENIAVAIAVIGAAAAVAICIYLNNTIGF